MEHREDLIKYRIERCDQTIDEATTAIENQSLTLAENRIYYSIFYIVSALALKYDFSTSKHSTLKGWFSQMFLKTREIDFEFGKTYSIAFEKRQRADYDDFVKFSIKEVSVDFEQSLKFIEQVKKMISEFPKEKEE